MDALEAHHLRDKRQRFLTVWRAMDAPLRARMLATAVAAAVVTLLVVVVVLPRWRKGAKKHAKAAELPAAEARALGEQLLWACEEERAGDALRLINEGADVNFRGEGGRMPPHRGECEWP